ncbi:unnamed protein product [Adineta ricciae]|uniref:RUN domain-containing protein n=1 Tax=Adineta ricciae TaxID=249248 RepID=A0A813VRK8_ADIRI|nr:unnamed protein product [Adineta ricciae]
MATLIVDGSVNIEREKANLLCLIKLTLNTLIDQSSSTPVAPVLDDRSRDVTNFILVLERILSFRMRGSWLTSRSYFWDFIRPACIGSCRQSIIERVEEVSNSRCARDKGRAWLKFALMEKKLSELLKLVISDCHLVRKYYHDDSIMTSSQAFIICDQLAALNTLDFSFCFKQDGPIIAPIMMNDSEIDVIDLTPFLSYKPKQMKPLFTGQISNEENKQPSSMNSADCGVIALEKHKLEVEQRKYFEELLRHRDRELHQLKVRYDTLQGERESEVLQMENIILELQLELRTARDEVELRRKKTQYVDSNTPPKNLSTSDSQKPTPVNDSTLSIELEGSINKRSSTDSISSSSNRSSQSITTTNTDDDQYELVRKLSSNLLNPQNDLAPELKSLSSPEMISSVTSLSDEEDQQKQVQTVTTTTPEKENTALNRSSQHLSAKVTVK